ncbi:hypothetical protein DPX16_20009 [Anabarilius grahami]|uniref:Uncharacterized protein n=1 Tax=Anabarilius grahami TaxID=495550 RepID=A0A3N0Z4Q3_ANAGA|nr:hypothetical protein DPX16_20009 [Anabarilius grahami]
MVTCKETRAAIIALHKNGFTGKDIVATKIAPKSTIYRFIKNFKERGSCKEGFRASKKVQQAPGSSPKEDSAAGLECHQCRACSGMAAGRCERICTHSEAKTFGRWPGVKKGSKEATSLQKKHQGQIDLLQKCIVNGLLRTGAKSYSPMKLLSDCLGHLEKGLSGEEKVSATISPVSCQQ